MKILSAFLSCFLAAAFAAGAAQQVITPNAGITGAQGRDIINVNFAELYARTLNVTSNAPFLTVTGGPTSSGTITINLTSGQTANRFLATPNGSTGTVSLRAIAAADIPDISGTYSTPASLATALAAYTGTTAVTTLGTITTGSWTGTAIADAYISSATAWNAKEPSLGNPASNGFVLSSTTGGTRSWIAAGGTGTVTSVGLTMPTALFVSPVSGTGGTATVSLAPVLATQSAHAVLAGPTTGSAATPTFRALAAGDIPDLSGTYLTGNQTVTLSGDATGSGATSIAVTIASGAVSNAKLANSAITIAGTSTSLGGSITLDTITGLSTTGLVKRTAGNTLAIAAAGTDYLAPAGNGSALTGLTQSQVSGLTTTDAPTFSNVRVTHSTLTYAATTTIDFTGDGFKTVTLAGNITFATSNLAAGRSKTVFIDADSSTRTLAFPAWKFVGAAPPDSIGAGKTAVLTITSRGTTDAACVAAFAVEP